MLLQINDQPIAADIAGVWTLTWIGNATVSTLMTTATVINQTYTAGTNKGSAFINMPPGEFNLTLNFATGNKGVTKLTAVKPAYNINRPFPTSFLTPLQIMETLRFTAWTGTCT